MRLVTKTVLGTLTLAALLASGCVVEEDGHMVVRYEFKNTKGPEGFTCAAVGITKVELTVQSASTGDIFSVTSPCLDGQQSAVFIDGIPTGGYTINTKFRDALENIVAEDNDVFDPNDPNAAVIKCEGLAAECVLDTVVSVNSTGDFTFGVDFGQPGGLNCSPLGSSMSNSQRLLVNNSAGQSITLRLLIPMVTPDTGKEYAPNASEMCIPVEVNQTMLNHFIGFYTMQVQGEANAVPPLVCYQSNALPFRITSVPGTLRTVFTAPLTAAGQGQAPCNAQ